MNDTTFAGTVFYGCVLESTSPVDSVVCSVVKHWKGGVSHAKVIVAKAASGGLSVVAITALIVEAHGFTVRRWDTAPAVPIRVVRSWR